MKNVLIALFLAAFTLGVACDADAKSRFGGGKSSGMQRDAVKRDATPPPAQPASQAGTATPAATPTPAPAAGGNKWLGPLAGLAAGGLLASLFAGGAFGGLKLFDILMMALLAIGLFMLLRAFTRRQSGGGDTPAGWQPAYAGSSTAPSPSTSAAQAVVRDGNSNRIAAPEIGSRLTTANATPQVIEEATSHPRIPADFDVVPFERQAKAAFIRMQAANDARDFADIRAFTTPEMYGEIALQLQERGDVPQKIDVVSVDARAIEVVVESARAVASVRFSGVIRENGEPAESFDEVWHVVKDLGDPASTWRVAGIQQLT